MYVDTSTVRGKKGQRYTRHLLRESFREAGKVRHRTIANLSQCSEDEVQAIKLALKHKKKLIQLAAIDETLSLSQGPSVGAVAVLYATAKKLGIVAALGHTRQGKLALWQIFARIINQGSRLSAVRLARWHAACDLLGLDSFNEDDLYANLDWLYESQTKIEDRCYRSMADSEEVRPGLFLYDVTSSYLEGKYNELGAFGYNRDGKKGRRQIVIGLLCDHSGRPLSIEVFPGNTSDTKTFASQVRKVADRFGAGEVTFVGDRGMIKGPQIEDLNAEQGFHYISAITRPQIETLLNSGIIQMGLFDETLTEILPYEGERLILRRNPIRRSEIAESRKDRLRALRKAIVKYNQYLKEHPRARVEVGLRRMQEKAEKLRISVWARIGVEGRQLMSSVDEPALEEISKLDGCYVLRTDLRPEQASMETVHARYKDLAMVEHAFRTSKTGHLEMRPLFLRNAARTRGYALVVMLAYRIVQELADRWVSFDFTVEEAVQRLSTLCAISVSVNGTPTYHQIPTPSQEIQQMIDAAGVTLPSHFRNSGITVSTRVKLGQDRVKR
jgi:transposase